MAREHRNDLPREGQHQEEDQLPNPNFFLGLGQQIRRILPPLDGDDQDRQNPDNRPHPQEIEDEEDFPEYSDAESSRPPSPELDEAQQQEGQQAACNNVQQR